MYIESEGIILKHTKPLNGRKMIVMLSKKFGKISAGTNINTQGKKKSSLAVRPFTYGRYEFYRKRDYFNINSAEAIKSFYKLGENIDKYMVASYVFEFTDKCLVEGSVQTHIFHLLIDFLNELEKRPKKYETLVYAYELKVFKELGYLPELNQCVICGKKENLNSFDIKNGGSVCKNCYGLLKEDSKDTLIYIDDLSIINILKFLINSPLKRLEKIALEEKVQKKINTIIEGYMQYHLDVGKLNSELFLSD